MPEPPCSRVTSWIETGGKFQGSVRPCPHAVSHFSASDLKKKKLQKNNFEIKIVIQPTISKKKATKIKKNSGSLITRKAKVFKNIFTLKGGFQFYCESPSGQGLTVLFIIL